MALADTLISKPPPIHEDETGTLRVGRTRVTLDTFVSAFHEGLTAEEIACEFPTLRLEDVYAAISYYLANKGIVDSYLVQRTREADALQARIERQYPQDGLRARLMARLHR